MYHTISDQNIDFHNFYQHIKISIFGQKDSCIFQMKRN
jgi:hypothetical protein